MMLPKTKREDIVDSAGVADALYKEHEDLKEKKHREALEELKVRRDTKIFLDISFLAVAAIIALCISSVSSVEYPLQHEGPVDSSRMERACMEVCSTAQPFPALSFSPKEDNVCPCLDIGLFNAFRKKESKDSPRIFSVSNITGRGIVLESNGCEISASGRRLGSWTTHPWNSYQLYAADCDGRTAFFHADPRRSDYGLNEPPVIVAKTTIAGDKETYLKEIQVLIARGATKEAEIDLSKTYDPDGVLVATMYSHAIEGGRTGGHGPRFTVTLLGDLPGAFHVNLTAIDDAGENATSAVTFQVYEWKPGSERTQYLVVGGLVSFLFTLVGLNEFQGYWNQRKYPSKVFKAMKKLAYAIFFGVICNALVMAFTIRLVYLPETVTQSVRADSFLPETDIGDPMTEIYIKAGIVLFSALFLLIAAKRAGIGWSLIAEELKKLYGRYPLQTLAGAALLILLLIAFMRVRFG